MTLWNVNGQMPAPPTEYPMIFSFVNAGGYMMTKTIKDERQFYTWRFINWGLKAEGCSLVTGEPKGGSEDGGLISELRRKGS